MGEKRLNNLDDMVVTARVISNMFDCTERWVRSLASEGAIDKEKSGSYRLQSTVEKYIKKAKREIAELELAKMKGTMHKAEDIEMVMTDMLSRLKSKLMAIPSKMAPLLGEEGDPIDLASKRTTTFWNKKKVYVSTPTIKGLSKIEGEYENSTKEEWNLPCPSCGNYQPLKWRQIKFEDSTMECDHCQKRFKELE